MCLHVLAGAFSNPSAAQLAQLSGLRVLIRAGMTDVTLPPGDFAVYFTPKARCGKHLVRSWPH